MEPWPCSESEGWIGAVVAIPSWLYLWNVKDAFDSGDILHESSLSITEAADVNNSSVKLVPPSRRMGEAILSALAYAASLPPLLLPFFSFVSWSGTTVSFTGLQIAAGNITDPSGYFVTTLSGPEPFVLAAIVCAIAGIVLSFLRPPLTVIAGLLGSAGAISMLILRYELFERIVAKGPGAGEISTQVGYGLVVLLLTTAAIWNFRVFLIRRPDAVAQVAAAHA